MEKIQKKKKLKDNQITRKTMQYIGDLFHFLLLRDMY